MKSILLPFLTALALLASPAPAVEIKPPAFVPASGLQLSLNTGGYKFFVGDPTAPPATTSARVAKLGGLLPTREGFAASAILANSSRTAIAFEFDDAGAAAVKFRFSVFDADGALVWQSDTDLVSAQVITADTLGKGQRWKRTIQIPLKADGAWLKPGLYTLEATLAATPSVSAATIFEVANFPEVPPGESGIIGHVFARFPSNSPVATNNPPTVSAIPLQQQGSAVITLGPISGGISVANAAVTVEEIRLPNARYDHPAFAWTGKTDASGNFKVVTPPGSFTVTATAVDVFAHNTMELQTYRGAADVTVETGKFSNVNIEVRRYSQSLTGIHGLVLIGPVRPVEIIGQSNEQPLAGAHLEITEILNPDVVYIRGPWHWTLKAGPDGRFTQATPSGRYRITASVPANDVPADPYGGLIIRISSTPVRFGTGTAEVTVPADGFAEVTVHVDSGIR